MRIAMQYVREVEGERDYKSPTYLVITFAQETELLLSLVHEDTVQLTGVEVADLNSTSTPTHHTALANVCCAKEYNQVPVDKRQWSIEPAQKIAQTHIALTAVLHGLDTWCITHFSAFQEY